MLTRLDRDKIKQDHPFFNKKRCVVIDDNTLLYVTKYIRYEVKYPPSKNSVFEVTLLDYDVEISEEVMEDIDEDYSTLKSIFRNIDKYLTKDEHGRESSNS